MSDVERFAFKKSTIEKRDRKKKFSSAETIQPVLEGGLPLERRSFEPQRVPEPFHFFDMAQGTPGSRHEANSLLHKISKPVQILGLGTLELLTSATAVLAGTVALVGTPITVGLSAPLVVVSAGTFLAVVGFKRFGAAARRMVHFR